MEIYILSGIADHGCGMTFCNCIVILLAGFVLALDLSFNSFISHSDEHLADDCVLFLRELECDVDWFALWLISCVLWLISGGVFIFLSELDASD